MSLGERVDYLTLVPNGEPTLDVHLGELLTRLKSFGVPLAVITNASLIGDLAVREALLQADWVSLKVDAVEASIWRVVDRPYAKLEITDILAGARTFARDFQGTLVTETMLVAGINDAPGTLTATAAVIADLYPAVAYLSIPTRPPAEPGVCAPDEAVLNHAYQIYAEVLPRVELLIGYEGNVFASTGDVAADLLSITAVIQCVPML